MSHAMIDIEAWGQPPDGAIVSIGAVNFDISTGELIKKSFDPTTGAFTINGRVSEIPATFYVAVDAADAQRRGMTINADTVYWWFQQDQTAINAWLQAERQPLRHALVLLAEWFVHHHPKAVWAKPPTYDCAILQTAFKLCGLTAPWNFRQERDVRTLFDTARMAGLQQDYSPRAAAKLLVADDPKVRGTKHNALDDAARQAALASEAYQYLACTNAGHLRAQLQGEQRQAKTLAHRVRFLLREMHRAADNLVEEEDEGRASFTFPDGETWYALREGEK